MVYKHNPNTLVFRKAGAGLSKLYTNKGGIGFKFLIETT